MVSGVGGTYKLQPGHPLVDGEFIFPRKVVQVLDQTGRELADAGCGFGARGIDDGLREVWVESVRLASCSCAV